MTQCASFGVLVCCFTFERSLRARGRAAAAQNCREPDRWQAAMSGFRQTCDSPTAQQAETTRATVLTASVRRRFRTDLDEFCAGDTAGLVPVHQTHFSDAACCVQRRKKTGWQVDGRRVPCLSKCLKKFLMLISPPSTFRYLHGNALRDRPRVLRRSHLGRLVRRRTSCLVVYPRCARRSSPRGGGMSDRPLAWYVGRAGRQHQVPRWASPEIVMDSLQKSQRPGPRTRQRTRATAQE